jgi:hypothetical protein
MAADDDEGDDSGQDWEGLCGAQKYDFQNYVSVDRDVATTGVSTVEELCDAYGSTRSVEEKNKEDEKEQDMVPSFSETYEALEKVKAFICAHSVKVIFSIEAKFCQQAKDNVLFLLKKVVFRISRFPAFIDHFLHSLEKR